MLKLLAARNRKPTTDPTKTLVLRRQFSADMTRRFKRIRSAITAVMREDVFDIGKEPVIGLQGPFIPQSFIYTRSQDKIDAFMVWLNEMEKREILEIISGPTLGLDEPWTNTYVRSAYQKGMANARSELAGIGVDLPTFGQIPGLMDPITAAFLQPFHADRVGLIYTRVFEALKGVDAEMDKQISRLLSKGIVEGRNPREIGRWLTDRVDKIGITRGQLIARTEVIQTFNEAALNEYKYAEAIVDEPVYAQWWSALDSKVRPTHQQRHGKVFTRERAQQLIGEPNCRCSLIPYIESIHGKITVIGRKGRRKK